MEVLFVDKLQNLPDNLFRRVLHSKLGTQIIRSFPHPQRADTLNKTVRRDFPLGPKVILPHRIPDVHGIQQGAVHIKNSRTQHGSRLLWSDFITGPSPASEPQPGQGKPGRLIGSQSEPCTGQAQAQRITEQPSKNRAQKGDADKRDNRGIDRIPRTAQAARKDHCRDLQEGDD